MKIIFIGDLVGKNARNQLIKQLPEIKKTYNPDAIVCNAENAAAGYGLTKNIALELFDKGIDIITLGNHSWDQKEMLSFIEECPKIIRPLNYPQGVPGKGYYELNLLDGRKLIVVQLMLRLFMGISLDDPFASIKNFLKKNKLGSNCNCILLDIHGETTSEKNAIAHYIDGEVTAVLGTHTHIPTTDARILPKGTAYQTDVGMSGDYNSVIGMDKNNPIHQFVKGYRNEGRFVPADGKVTICGAFVESSDNSGLASKIEPFQIV